MAKTADDLKILSACLQDAIVPAHHIVYNPKTKEFSLLLDRFQWECISQKKGQRIHTALSIAHVESAQVKGIQMPAHNKEKHILSHLDIKDDTVTLSFLSGAKIRLKVQDLKIKLRDSGLPWPAPAPAELE